ncbi:dual specificity protein phosphatase MPK-4-like [Euwallacea fornicatus]|uniref:dual specificity protein phosphatase MPK-4-like n=1 Tax=Euwallacea fornicatus TaxID=995702 RepID=UPI00338E5B14
MSSYLHRDDFGLCPISVDEIEPGLFLGSLAAAKDIDTLHKLKISHILTIDTCPLPRTILDLSHLKTKFIQLSDLPKEDLLSHFNDTNEFIENALKGGCILVHCYFGVSRSSTVVIAYIMKKYQLSYSEAFERVKAKRHIVFPNQGFVTQLKLYKDMNHTIDASNMKYKLFRLNLASDRVRKVKILPHNFIDLIQPDPGLPQTQPHPNVYRCRKCRRILASECNLIVHQDKGSKCTKTFFLEPIVWMNVAQNTEGKLHCPKCENKVGSFSWVMGCQCPCGTKVAPAFYLVPSKVDYTNVVKNVEMTF